MHPILFEIGNLKIYSYGVMVALGFLLAVFLASRTARRDGLPSGVICDIFLYSLIWGIAGARVLHVILNPRPYISNPLNIFMINEGGLAIHGGLFAGILTAWYLINKNNLPLWKTAGLIMPYIALGQAIGRIGCILNGCCYGKPTYSFFGFYADGRIIQPIHPTQLYISVYLLLMFIALRFIYEKSRNGRMIFFTYLILFSSGRFAIDFFRGDLTAVLYGLSISQFISMAIFFASSLLLLLRSKKA
ncbi:MAG: prolipoprotein diacylglyceryl transferase [Candidatus Omnitrophica bacterium]|nr:prolipoprotein diacylglyceryl transferase [Candidatus Omnitrophota bacterium]